jgi:tricorn protease
MSKNALFSTVCFVIIFSLCLLAEEEGIKLARYPAPSPDSKMLAFCFQGDIWIVPIDGGHASRLTVHPGYDALPLWSPDGKHIAFSSNRYGNDDIFLINITKGDTQQLTYFSNPDALSDWSTDGKYLIFSSNRDFSYHRIPVLYKVSLEGGTPIKLIDALGYNGRISPDGKKLVFLRGRPAYYRKHYRGSDNTNLWLFDFDTKEYKQLTDHKGNDFWPMWASNGISIFYVTDEDGVFNLWQLELETGNKKQLTFYKEDGIRYAQISRDGKIIAYERERNIYTIPTTGGEGRPITIIAPADPQKNLIERKTMTTNAQEIAVSPDSKQIAFVVRGDIFVMPEKGGKATRLTTHPARDYQICWSPDSKKLLFSSLRNGNLDLFVIISDEPDEPRLYKSLKHQIEQLTKDPLNEYSAQFSPDGEMIAFIKGNGNLWVMKSDGSQPKLLLEGWDAPQYSWSPDSNWIAYSRVDNEFNSDIFIMPADGGKSVNISRHPDDDFDPQWSKDGRRLSFVSRRTANQYDLWYVWLRKEDAEKTKEELKEEFEEAKEKIAEKKKEEKEKEKKIEVKIDFEDIHMRLQPVVQLPGDEIYFALSPDGKTYVLVSNAEGKMDLWSVKWDGTKLKKLTTGGKNPSYIQFSKDGKKVYYLMQKGLIGSVAPDGKDAKTIGFNAKMKVNLRSEKMMTFDEAWQALNTRFYDPNFHGADWSAMKKKYRSWAVEASCAEDFYDVVLMMIGELNSSHMGIYAPSPEERVTTGLLGAIFDETYQGPGMKIKRIVPKSPADEETSKLKAGEIILEINGTEITPNTNMYKLLNDTIGEKVLLKVAKDEKAKDGREVVIKPVGYSEFRNALYNEWVEQRRAIVDKLSNGRLGYLHIQAMDMPSLEMFEMELYSEVHDKDGLIIDVRNNGGGWTTDYVLAMLQVRRHAYTIPRDGEKGYPQDRLPLYYWDKPTALMCNEYSYSNAEIISHAFKSLKRGKLIGYPTSGAVISTGGTQLIDGSFLRLPFRGWYVISTGLNMEGNGAEPDIIVKEQPQDEAMLKDRQLEKAVEVLLQEIK